MLTAIHCSLYFILTLLCINCLLQSQYRLQSVALVYDSSRLHFTLSSTHVLDNQQLAAAELFQVKSGNAYQYQVSVKFNSEKTGFFSQRVVFDFGSRPVVGRTLSVNMHGTLECQERVISLQQELQLDRWTGDNCRIVPFEQTSADLDAKLLEQYKLPSDINDIINTETINSELNENNYTRRMHSLLWLEEFTRMKIISQ